MAISNGIALKKITKDKLVNQKRKQEKTPTHSESCLEKYAFNELSL